MTMRGILLAAVAAGLLGCAGSPGRIMTWEEYTRLSPSWPHVIDAGPLFYFGAAHSNDPADPQFAQIEAAWNAFRPDIAFTEGGSPPVEASREEAIAKHGESGLVRFLAARDDVPATTLDPSRAEEVAALASEFPKERIKLFFLLRAASQFVRRSGTAGLDAEMERILRIYAEMPGLRGSPRTVAELAAMYASLFPGRGDYSAVPASWFDPVRSDTFLNAIARTGSEYRDRYVVARLTAHLREGRRVFAVMGGTHVVMQERAIRALLRDVRR